MTGTRACPAGGGWPLERILFTLAGSVALLSALRTARAAMPWTATHVLVVVAVWLLIAVALGVFSKGLKSYGPPVTSPPMKGART